MADQFRLRLSVIDGAYVPELRCPWCGQWLFINTENWEPNEWHMCLACKRMQAKLYARLKQADAEYRTKNADKARRYRVWLKKHAPTYLPAYERDRRGRERKRSQGYRDARKETNEHPEQDPG